MPSITQALDSTQTRSLRIYRWVSVWLYTSGIIALLLLANSIRDYFFVSRIIATEQVRHRMSQHAAALERQLRQDPAAKASAVSSLMKESTAPLWLDLRAPDGSLLEHAGAASQRLFSDDDERTHARNHEPLYKVIRASVGSVDDKSEVVVEAFAIRAPVNPAQPPPLQPGPPSPMMLEMAMPLSTADQNIFWPIRRNLLINCSGAIALQITVIIAGLGFRSYARGKHLEEQLAIAGQVQSELLPSMTQQYAGVQLATEYTPAEQVGGDFYDVFPLKSDGRNQQALALVMGDVSGKGIPAALLMGVIHGAVRSSQWSSSPAQHAFESQRLNRLLCDRAAGDRFASMFWCYHDPAAHVLSYVNAGHCPPLLARKNGRGIEISSLQAGGPVLGILPDATYVQEKVEISAGDVLVMYSDGLVEAENSEGQEYGEERLRALLATLTEKTADEIRRAILSSLSTFRGSLALRDDLTIVVAKFT